MYRKQCDICGSSTGPLTNQKTNLEYVDASGQLVQLYVPIEIFIHVCNACLRMYSVNVVPKEQQDPREDCPWQCAIDSVHCLCMNAARTWYTHNAEPRPRWLKPGQRLALMSGTTVLPWEFHAEDVHWRNFIGKFAILEEFSDDR